LVAGGSVQPPTIEAFAVVNIARIVASLPIAQEAATVAHVTLFGFALRK
jgi:hypothetical protein